MDVDRVEVSWMPALRQARGPLYLANCRRDRRGHRAGRLKGGRAPAAAARAGGRAGIDFTTVSRAYNEARRRGLVEGRVGQGTYVTLGAGAPHVPRRTVWRAACWAVSSHEHEPAAAL